MIYADTYFILSLSQVHTDVRGKNKWTKCFEEKNVVLPIGYHLGLSSSTGQLADNHDVVMLKTYEVDLVEGQVFNQEVSFKYPLTCNIMLNGVEDYSRTCRLPLQCYFFKTLP